MTITYSPSASMLRRSMLLLGAAALLSCTSPSPPPASAAPESSVYSPPISGELLRFDDPRQMAGLVYTHASGRREDGTLRVTFSAGAPYPNVAFPVSEGGWNLSAFGGVRVTLHNPQDHPVTAYLRVDNTDSATSEPWNTQRIRVAPGATADLRLVFGETNGAPGYPLDASRVSAMQLFLIRPARDVTLAVSDLRAWGSPGVGGRGPALTSPADRAAPVTPPDWLGARPPVPGDWVQTLNENFDGDTLDESLWTTRFPWDGPKPGQLQRYAPENVTVREGVLRLTSEKRSGHENNDPRLGTREFTSGLVQSYDKFAQRYGYFEARVKLPTARGLWPAFWLMPDRGRDSGLDIWRRRDTTDGGMEIDILEHLTEWGPGRNNVAVHWDGYGAAHKSWGTSHVYFGPTPDGWHVFGLLWEPGRLEWYIDGKKVAVYENERVSRVPGYIKLNTQMGGWATSDINVAALPDMFQVDYVRVWRRRDPAAAE